MNSSKAIFYDWDGGNAWLFKQVNGVRGGEWYDKAMLGISNAADYHHFPYYLAALLAGVLCLFVWRTARRQGGNKHYLAVWLGIALVLCAGFAAEAVVIKSLKEHFAYPRPYAALPVDEVHVVQSRRPEDAHHSFPSGHTAFATLMVFSLWPGLSRRLRGLGLCCIVAVMWSRLSLGMHFPADVLASFLIMTALVLLIRSIIYTLLRQWFHLSC